MDCKNQNAKVMRERLVFMLMHELRYKQKYGRSPPPSGSNATRTWPYDSTPSTCGCAARIMCCLATTGTSIQQCLNDVSKRAAVPMADRRENKRAKSCGAKQAAQGPSDDDDSFGASDDNESHDSDGRGHGRARGRGRGRGRPSTKRSCLRVWVRWSICVLILGVVSHYCIAS